MHRGWVEPARAAQGFFAQELADKFWLGIHMEGVHSGTEDYFAPSQPGTGIKTNG
jgi:hypothetical protein